MATEIELQLQAPQWKKFFFRCFAAALVIHLITAWFSLGFQYQDEQSQIMDFAGYKMGMVPLDKLSWEYKAQIRQGIQPLAVVALYRTLEALHIANPFLCTFILRIFSGLLGWLSVLLITREFCRRLSSEYWRRFLVLLSCFMWPIAFIQSHFSCESISGSLFFLGVVCLLALQRKEEEGKKNIWLLMGAGALLGLAFVVRNQTAFMIMGLGLWCIFIGRYSFKKIIIMVLPALLMVGIGIIIDHWLYGEWVFSAYRYFYVNLVEDKVSEFGVSPFYYYFYMYYIAFIPVISVFIMGLIVFSWFRYPRHILTWICVPFFIIHSLIGHKEMRFLWPLIDAIPLLLVLPFQNMDVSKLKSKAGPIAVKVMWGLNIILLIFFSCKPGYNAFGMYEYIYNYTKTNGDTYIVSNVRSPWDMDGATISFQKPHNVVLKRSRNVDSIKYYAKASPLKNVLIAINNNAQADSFEKAYPHIKRLYKSWPAWMNYMKLNNPDAVNQVWYLYKWEPGTIN